MKWIRVAFSVAQLFLTLVATPRGKAVIDGMLDLVEDAFADDKSVQDGCKKVREALMVPDDD